MNLTRAFVLLDLFCMSIMHSPTLHAMGPPPGFDDKSVAQLLPMLDSADDATREHAAVGISWQLHYYKHGATNTAPELIRATFSKTASMVTNDRNYVVRLACVDVLKVLDGWTNTIPALVRATDTTNCGIGIA